MPRLPPPNKKDRAGATWPIDFEGVNEEEWKDTYWEEPDCAGEKEIRQEKKRKEKKREKTQTQK